MRTVCWMYCVVYMLCLETLIEALFISPTIVVPASDSRVWSLATRNIDGSTNMNIITFCSQISIKPVPIWSISLYTTSLTCRNFIRDGWGVLQLLNQKHQNVVTTLGKQSGYQINKIDELMLKGYRFDSLELPDIPTDTDQRSISILNKGMIELFSDSSCCLYIERVDDRIFHAGDHDVVYCVVKKSFLRDNVTELHVDKDVLTTGFLRNQGLL